MGVTSIGWTNVTWSPVRGCTRVSAGCTACYAEKLVARFSDPGMWGHGYAERTKAGPRWTGKVDLIPEKLAEPLSWRAPRMCFVNSTSDLFHEKLTNEKIAAVYGVMAACPDMVFQVLTKRPERRREFHRWLGAAWNRTGNPRVPLLVNAPAEARDRIAPDGPWPLPWVWEGTSVEDQETANRRVWELIETPAAVRFISYEPALAAVNFERFFWGTTPDTAGYYKDGKLRSFGVGGQTLGSAPLDAIQQVIIGGESGPNRRPFEVEWVRSTVEQCRAAGVACFVKQDAGPRPGMQGRIPDELWDIKEFPASLRRGTGR